MITKACSMALGCVLLVAAIAQAADFYQVRGGIPNSQCFFTNDKVGNQYLFFIGNSVLAGTGLKDANLRYSAQMVKGFKKHFADAGMSETRHMQPGGSWFGLFRCSRGQAVFGEVICSGHLAILDFAAGDRDIPPDQAKLSIEGLIRQVTLYRATHSRILVYTLTPEMLADYRAGRTPEYIRVGEQVAEHYGVPSLNLGAYLQEAARKAGFPGVAVTGCASGKPEDGFSLRTNYNVKPKGTWGSKKSERHSYEELVEANVQSWQDTPGPGHQGPAGVGLCMERDRRRRLARAVQGRSGWSLPQGHPPRCSGKLT